MLTCFLSNDLHACSFMIMRSFAEIAVSCDSGCNTSASTAPFSDPGLSHVLIPCAAWKHPMRSSLFHRPAIACFLALWTSIFISKCLQQPPDWPSRRLTPFIIVVYASIDPLLVKLPLGSGLRTDCTPERTVTLRIPIVILYLTNSSTRQAFNAAQWNHTQIHGIRCGCIGGRNYFGEL